MCSKANLLTLVVVKESAASSKDFRQLVLKRPKLPMAFRERILQTG